MCKFSRYETFVIVFSFSPFDLQLLIVLLGCIADPAVCLSVTRLCCANTAERIEVLLGVRTIGVQGTSCYGVAAFVKLLWPLLQLL